MRFNLTDMVSGLCTTEPVCLCPTNFKSNYSNEQNLIPPLLHSLVTAQKYRSEGWVDVISCHASWLVNLVSPEMTGNPPLKRADEKQFVAPPINILSALIIANNSNFKVKHEFMCGRRRRSKRTQSRGILFTAWN